MRDTSAVGPAENGSTECGSASLNGQSIGELTGGQVRLPLVSIIIINYNYADFLEESVGAACSQDYENLEIVIVDNASTDNSREVIESLISRDPRLSVIYSEKNHGPLGAALLGIEATHGEFVGFFDADDCLMRNSISWHLQAHLAAKRDVAFTASNVLQVTADGSLISGGRWGAKQASKTEPDLHPRNIVPLLPTISPDTFDELSRLVTTLPASMKGWLWFGSSANLFRRAALDLVRPHDPSLRTMAEDGFFMSADSYFTHNCHWLGGSLLIDRPLHVYRMHGRNQFNRGLKFAGLQRPDSPVRSFLPRRYFEIARDILARHAHIAELTSPERFWRIFDLACDRMEFPLRETFDFEPEARNMIAPHLPSLIAEFGTVRTLIELRSRIGARHLLPAIRDAYAKDVPRLLMYSAIVCLPPRLLRRLERHSDPSPRPELGIPSADLSQ